MAQCISPYFHKEQGMNFPCGRCYPCKMRRVNGWMFRLEKQAEISDTALFVTLTYDNNHIPITKNNFMTLDKRDCQLFMKRLRINYERSCKELDEKPKKISYYLAGEYGSKTKRPHYHIIIFNAWYADIEKSWDLGEIHYGNLTPASAAYTLKYISKDSTIPMHKRDDRIKEFSLMSKGLGANYLTPIMIRWHRKRTKTIKVDGLTVVDTTGFYLPYYDKKLAIPRYYKNKIWSKTSLQAIGLQFSKDATEAWQKLSEPQKLAKVEENEELYKSYAFMNGDKRKTVL